MAQPDGRSSGARTTQQRRSTDRQRAMVDAAARLLIEHGPAAITHRRVAAEAGVPAGSAGYYFPSQAALYAEAVRAAEQLRAAAAHEFADGLARRRRGPRRTAELLIRALYAPHVEQDVVPARLEPMLAATRTEGLREIMRASRPRLLAALSTVLRRSGYTELADTEDVDLLAQVVDASLLYATSAGQPDVLGFAARTAARILELTSHEKTVAQDE